MSIAASHGHKKIMNVLISHALSHYSEPAPTVGGMGSAYSTVSSASGGGAFPAASRTNRVMSLAEILAEGATDEGPPPAAGPPAAKAAPVSHHRDSGAGADRLGQALFLCAPFLSKKENVHLFSSSLPRFDKQCHETSRIFPRTEQTFARARSFGVIS